MATRNGATKTVGGKRYRYTNGKWQQIKATGNVSPTSSRSRSARSSQSNASVSNDSNRPRRGGVRTTTDTQRTSTGSAKVTGKPNALPPGTKGGALATTKGPRRRNVNSNPPSSGTRTGRGGLPPRLRGVLETRGALPPAGNSKGSLPPANGSRKPPKGRMGPLSALVEQGASRLLSPVARTVGYEGAKAVRGALGGGAPTRDKNGNPISKTPYTGPGLKDVNGKPLPAPNKAFIDNISSKAPGGSGSSSNSGNNKNTPKPTPTGSTGSSGSRSGGSGPVRKPTPTKPARKPQSKDMDANYRAWAKANPKLAAKVKKGQAGYKAINSSKSNQPKNAGAGNGAPGAQSRSPRSTSAAAKAVKAGIREGRAADKSIAKIVPPKKKKKAASAADANDRGFFR